MLRMSVMVAALYAGQADAQGIESRIRCGTFLDLADGVVPLSADVSGHISVYLEGVTSTANTSRLNARDMIEAACEDRPQVTLRQAVVAAKKEWD